MDKKIFFSMFFVTAIMSCSTDDTMIPNVSSGNSAGSVSGGVSNSSETASTDLTTFDITTDTTPLTDEAEVADVTNEDFVESLLAEETDGLKKLSITYSGTTATWTYSKKSGEVIAESTTAGNSYADDDVSITKSGAHVTVTASKKINYILQGSTTDGGLKLYSDKKFIIDLNGVTMINKSGAAINIQKGTDGDKRCYLRVVDGTVNNLSDGTTYSTPSDEDEKGVVFSEGKILVSGNGTLNITANGKNGLVSDDYIYLHRGTVTMIKPADGYSGIKANDGIYIAGGVHNIVCEGSAPKGLNCDSLICVTGGRTTIINKGVAVYDSSEKDYSQPSCVKCDSIVTINGGELLCKATGNGGKGIRADFAYIQNGGMVKVITEGKTISTGSSDAEAKGLHVGSKSESTGLITINGGKLTVRCTGGEGSEGIESKNSIVINGGLVESHCYDDAINAAKSIKINGGYVYANATNNDGIDSNGTLTIAGGVILSCGASAPEEGFDCDQNTFAITGGVIVGIGGASSTPTSSACTQASLLSSMSLSSRATLALTKSDGSAIMAFEVPARYSGTYMVLISAPGLAIGNAYNIMSGSTVEGTSFHGLIYSDLSVTGGNAAYTYTQSSLVTGSTGGGFGGGGMPGGMPNRW